MPNPSKRKGNAFERELVNAALERGLSAKRAYASDGQSLGEAPEVDVVVNDWRLQAKRRKAIADYLTIPSGCDAVVFRQDRGPVRVLMDWDRFLELISADYEILEVGNDVGL